jgi:hypothetical protein
MSKSSQQEVLNSSNDFSPSSFVIFCLDEDGNIAFQASWGETPEDIKKFALLLNKVNSGSFDKMIIEQLKEQSKEQGDTKNFTIFSKAYKELNKSKDLVVDPINVELN